MNLSDILPAISAFFNDHQFLGVVLAGFISFIESLAIIGSIIPGSVVMTIVGFLLGVGAIPLPATIISVFIGAFIGDFISYALGAYFKDHIRTHHWVQPYEHWLQHGEAFMRKHGALSIVIGRFVGPMRSMVPMIAGIAQMNLAIFTIAIIPTIILWAIVYLTPGVLLGSLSIDMGESMFSYFLSRSLVIITLGAIWYSLHSLVRIAHPHLVTKKLHLSLDPDSFTHLIKGIILLLTIVVFGYYSLSVPPNEYWLNKSIYHLMTIYSTDSNISLAKAFTLVLGPESYILINIAIFSVLYYHRYLKLAAIWSASALGLILVTLMLKHGIYSPRPNPLLGHSSFPSGHVLLMGTLLLCLSSLAQKSAHAIGLALRRISYLIIIVLCCSRLILQAHWASDVIFSLLLSLSLWNLVSAFKKHLPHIPSAHTKQVGAACILILLPFISIKSYLPQPMSPKLPEPIAVNQSFDIQNIPALRYSRFGYPNAPINFVFSGTRSELDRLFAKIGWQPYPSSGQPFKRLMTLFRFREYQDILPLLPPLLNNHSPNAIYGVITDDSAYIAKIWQLEGSKETYAGTISRETYPESFFNNKLFICQKDRFNIERILFNTNYDTIRRPAIERDRCIDAFFWDGKVAYLQG